MTAGQRLVLDVQVFRTLAACLSEVVLVLVWQETLSEMKDSRGGEENVANILATTVKGRATPGESGMGE